MIEIHDYTNREYLFGELELGQPFLSDGVLYIKIREVEEVSADPLLQGSFNAVAIYKDGCGLTYVLAEQDVKPVNLKIDVEDILDK